MPDVNLLSNNQPSRKKSGSAIKWIFRCLTLVGIVFVVFVIAISANALFSQDSLAQNLAKLNIFTEVRKIVTDADVPLQGAVQDRINVLLLGIGGLDHHGTQLTDTIIIASIVPSTGKVALISIPRDLVVPIPGHGFRKINHSNALAEQSIPGSGGQKTAELVSDLFDIPIHYYVRIDFDGFTNLVDEFGGVDVYVDNTLNDYQYPIRGRENAYPIESRFEHLHIEKGWQNMDGELALKYVRSRHAAGLEGSDFARSARQQKVLSAFKKKVLSVGTVFSPQRINALVSAYSDNVTTNVTISEGLKLIELVKPIEEQDIFRLVLDNSSDGPLQSATITDRTGNKAYILQPKTGDFTHIQGLVKQVFDHENKDIQLALALSEEPVIEIQDATQGSQEAQTMFSHLEEQGFSHLYESDFDKDPLETSVIYDLTNGQKTHTLSYLKKQLPEALVITTASLSDEVAHTEDTHFLLLIGDTSTPES